jgi:hypothetical protein
MAGRRNCRSNWGYLRNDPERCKISTLGLACSREPILMDADGKISYLAINKFSNCLIWLEKSKTRCGAMLWPFMHAEKNSSHFDTGVFYLRHKGHAPLRRTLTTSDGYPRLFRCRKLLKLTLFDMTCSLVLRCEVKWNKIQVRVIPPTKDFIFH